MKSSLLYKNIHHYFLDKQLPDCEEQNEAGQISGVACRQKGQH